MKKQNLLYLLLAIIVMAMLAVFLYQIPFINQRLAWRVDSWRARIKYTFKPPEEEIFVPSNQQAQLEEVVDATFQALTLTLTPSSTATPTPFEAATLPSGTITPSLTPTATTASTPLPSKIRLEGVRIEDQTWNNCGPANLSMALSYWGWKGDQAVTAAYLKPNERDKNVMPYEMVAYVKEETNLDAVSRIGGDLETIKRFLAAEYPVLVEAGFEGENFDDWMGHYQVITAYDDTNAQFLTQDSYKTADTPVSYQDMEKYWRHFNYRYIIIYPPEQGPEVQELLGPHYDEIYNFQQTAAKASNEIYALNGRAKFFAWFNRGSSLVALDDYAGAAIAYDEAFRIYPQLAEEERPWRMMWYQTGPYWAYYYTGRYYDVLSLATQTIENVSEPAIEESWYWRALAREALGDISGAIADLEKAVDLNENFEIGWYHLNRLRDQ